MSEGEKQFERALAVDDESAILRVMPRLLRTSCETVEVLDSGNSPIMELIEQIRGKLCPNLLLILDGQYNGGTAEDIIEALQTALTENGTHVLVITGHPTTADRVSARFSQVSVLGKPFTVDEFTSTAKASVPFTA